MVSSTTGMGLGCGQSATETSAAPTSEPVPCNSSAALPSTSRPCVDKSASTTEEPKPCGEQQKIPPDNVKPCQDERHKVAKPAATASSSSPCIAEDEIVAHEADEESIVSTEPCEDESQPGPEKMVHPCVDANAAGKVPGNFPCREKIADKRPPLPCKESHIPCEEQTFSDGTPKLEETSGSKSFNAEHDQNGNIEIEIDFYNGNVHDEPATVDRYTMIDCENGGLATLACDGNSRINVLRASYGSFNAGCQVVCLPSQIRCRTRCLVFLNFFCCKLVGSFVAKIVLDDVFA